MMKISLKQLLPRYAVLPLIAALSVNMAVYAGSRICNAGRAHRVLKIAADDYVPFVPAFIVIYLLAFLQWGLSYTLAARESREVLMRVVLGDIVAKLVTGLIFILVPTTIARPEITGNSFFEQLTKLIYELDAPDNLFPSIHCLESWMAFRAAGMMKKTPKWYLPLSLVFTLLVFASTVTLRQHLLPDIPGGVLVAEIGLFAAGRMLRKRSAPDEHTQGTGA